MVYVVSCFVDKLLRNNLFSREHTRLLLKVIEKRQEEGEKRGLRTYFKRIQTKNIVTKKCSNCEIILLLHK